MSTFRQTIYFEPEKSPCDRCKDTAFDICSILISELDVLSDIYIAYTFWVHEQFCYFYISLSILIVVHLSYCILFVHLCILFVHPRCCCGLS